MNALKAFTLRHRDNRVVYCLLWAAIVLGIVPAIVAQNILPFDSFVLHFGIEIDQLNYLPSWICQLLVGAGLVICIVQKRFLFIPLLLPLLAVSHYDIEQLIYKLPSYTQAQDMLRENYQRSAELDSAPTAKTILDELDDVDYMDGGLIAFDEDALRKELELIRDNQQDLSAAQGPVTDKIKKDIRILQSKIKTLNEQIRQANNQSSRIRKALRDTRIISKLSFGLTDKNLKNKLQTMLQKVNARKNSLNSKRNSARAAISQLNKSLKELGAINQRLYQLNAEVNTYLWASQSLESWRLARAYGLLSFLVLLVIIGRFSLGSWIYLSTLSASFAVSMLYVEGPLAFRLWTIVSFVLVSLVLRVLYLACVENFPLLRRQSGKFICKTCVTTFMYYLPFTILILTADYLTDSIQDGIDAQIYAIEDISDSNPRNNTRRYDIDIGIDAFFAKRERKALDDIGDISTIGSNVVDDIAAGVVSAFKQTFPANLGTGFQVTPCPRLEWVFEPADCAQREVKYSMNEGYRKVRANQLDALENSAKNYKRKVGKQGERAIAIAREDLSQNILAVRLGLKKQLGHIYTAIDFYSGLMLIVLILAILKSLLYVFARIFFASEVDSEDRKIQFEPSLIPVQQGSIEEISGRLDLTAEHGKEFFVNKHFDFANAPPDEVTPQAHKALFSRLINGVWHMNRIQLSSPDQADNRMNNLPYRRLPDDERIVAWTLRPGDAVIFSWKNFVGMNENIQIRRQYSWQLSSLVFGRMFYVVASVDPESTSDGYLLLSARGSDGIEPSDNPSNSPDQLLAWQTTTRFQLHANLTLRNIYRSGIQIRAMESDLAVMHINQRKRKSGAASFLKYFIVPV